MSMTEVVNEVSASRANNRHAAVAFPPLDQVSKPNLTTLEAAYYLNRTPGTMRVWACKENGPLRPRRTNGYLDWPTSEVKRIAGVCA